MAFRQSLLAEQAELEAPKPPVTRFVNPEHARLIQKIKDMSLILDDKDPQFEAKNNFQLDLIFLVENDLLHLQLLEAIEQDAITHENYAAIQKNDFNTGYGYGADFVKFIANLRLLQDRLGAGKNEEDEYEHLVQMAKFYVEAKNNQNTSPETQKTNDSVMRHFANYLEAANDPVAYRPETRMPHLKTCLKGVENDAFGKKPMHPVLKAIIGGIIGAVVGAVIFAAIGAGVTCWAGGVGAIPGFFVGLVKGFTIGTAISVGALAGSQALMFGGFFAKLNVDSREKYEMRKAAAITSNGSMLGMAEVMNPQQAPRRK